MGIQELLRQWNIDSYTSKEVHMPAGLSTGTWLPQMPVQIDPEELCAGAVYSHCMLKPQGKPSLVAEAVDSSVSSLWPEAAVLLLVLLKLPSAAYAVVFTDSLSLLTSLLSYCTRAGSRHELTSQHAPTIC